VWFTRIVMLAFIPAKHSYACTHTYTYAYTHPNTYAYTHIHICIYIHIHIQIPHPPTTEATPH
jgi:hypothetical protein